MTTKAQRRTKHARDTGTRDQLVEAARRCLRTRGLAETSSRAVTELAGANLASITYYFGSKEALVATALATELRDWIQPALDRLAEPDDPVVRLLGAVELLNATFDDQRDRLPGLIEVFVHAARDTSADDPIAEIWVDARAQLSAVVAELRALDAVPTWVEPDAMAALIVSVVAGTVVNELVAPDGVGHRVVAAQFATLLINA